MNRKFKDIPTLTGTQISFDMLVRACHGRAWNAGWFHDPETGREIERNHGEMFALMHSEISEAMEGIRKNLKDDKLPQYDMAAVEICDLIIRACDYLGRYYPHQLGALTDKMKYNETRADHKPQNRLKENGKKF